MKIFKFSVVFLCIAFAICFAITAGLIIRQNVIDIMINENISSLTHGVKYQNPVKITGVPVIKQKIDCGYACIEMLSEYLGGNGLLTEEILFEKNGKKITTSSNNGLYGELKKRLPDYKITQYKNLKNIELIDMIYKSLSDGMPVIISYAAADMSLEEADGPPVWTVHYGIASHVDIPNDEITVINPYGYAETYSVEDFLRATRFESYENMEFYTKFKFAAGVYSKNTVYIIEDMMWDLK